MAPLDDRQNVAEWPPYGGNHHRQHQGALLPQSAQASPAQQRLPSHHGGHSRLSTRPHQTKSRLLLSPPTCYNGGVKPIIGVLNWFHSACWRAASSKTCGTSS